jgi:hypothetical protein
MAPARPTSRRRFPVAGSGKSLPPLQNVKEQARERRTEATLPLFGGTATFILIFIFHLNSPQITPNTQNRKGEEFLPIRFPRILRFTPFLVARLQGGRCQKRREKGMGMIGKGIKTGWSVSSGRAPVEGPGVTYCARLNPGEGGHGMASPNYITIPLTDPILTPSSI